MRIRRGFEDAAVRAVFEEYPVPMRSDLLHLRDLIFEVGRETERVGDLIETLKWGQRAYMPSKPRIRSTVRMGAFKASESKHAIFFHRQTTLVTAFREIHGGQFAFEGNRAIVLPMRRKVPRDALKHCIAMALTYHVKPERR